MSSGYRVMLAGLVMVFGIAATCLAGAMYQNTSGAVARVVRIHFSEPAEITSTWPSFSQRDPQGPSTVIVLSGGEVPAGGWFSFSWRPDSARVIEIEWLPQRIQPTDQRTRWRGVNMALEMADETDLHYLATQWNANLVRVCLYMAGEWGYFVPNPKNPTAIQERDWEALDRFLLTCQASGLRVIIDLHQWLGYQYLNDKWSQLLWQVTEYQDALVAFWQSLAARYAAWGEVIYGYDLLNEPHWNDVSVETLSSKWFQLASRIAKAIREVDRAHAIIIECPSWGNPDGFDAMLPLDVENIIYSFHMWVPHSLTHQGVSGRPVGIQYIEGTIPQLGGLTGVEWLRRQLQPVLNFRNRYGVPIMVGEIGVSACTDDLSRARYLRDCLNLFEEFGFDYCLWCYAEWGCWSLEHTGCDGTCFPRFAGRTEALSTYLSFLSRNERPLVNTTQRPRCLFDVTGWVSSRQSARQAGDLLWKATRVFEVIELDGPFTKEALSSVDVVITGTPRPSLTSEETELLKAFVSSGGGLLFYGTWGCLGKEDLLRTFDLAIVDTLIRVDARDGHWDTASYWTSSLGPHPICENVVIYHPSWTGYIDTSRREDVLVWSLNTAWLDRNGNQLRDPEEPMGPFALAAATRIGSGRVVVIADLNFNLTANYTLTFNALRWLSRHGSTNE